MSSEEKSLLDQQPDSIPSWTDRFQMSEEWKMKLRLFIPHFAVLLLTVIYAMVGAALFYGLEHQHELDARQEHLGRIRIAKQELITKMYETSQSSASKEEWKAEIHLEIRRLTHILHKASQGGYVNGENLLEALQNPQAKAEPVWGFGSALFFSFTTMATIGYGNVVPVTAAGRVVCVFFALLGTPLAIITIADLGKFFSESTIWLFHQYQKAKRNGRKCLRDILKRLRAEWHGKGGENKFGFEPSVGPAVTTAEELALDSEAKVPATLVFAIFLLYIGFGAIMFHMMEGWSSWDSFYFCFITLTTVGFGDMVPKTQSSMLAIMLIYIVVGLALTTMCIDLVGLQYIEKIHYLGQKLKRPQINLSSMLKKRKQLELNIINMNKMRRQALCDNDRRTPTISEPRSEPTKPPEIPIWPTLNLHESDDTESGIDEMSFSTVSLSTSGSVYQRQRMYTTTSLDLRRNFAGSWMASGPDVTCKCSLTPSLSIEQRERIYASVTFSLDLDNDYQVEWVPPTPDFEKIANECKAAHRSASCPGLYVNEEDALEELVPIDYGFSLQEAETELVIAPTLFFENLPIYAQVNETVSSEGAIAGVLNCKEKYVSGDQPKLVTDNFCFILDGDKVRLSEMIADDSWKQTGHPTKFYYSEDLRVFHKVQMITSNGRVVRAQFSRPKKSAAKHQRHRLTRRRDSEPTKFVDEPPEEIDPKGEVPLSKVYKVTRFYSFWRSCAGFHRIITVITPGAGGIGQNATSPEMKKRFFVQYIWRNASEADRVRVGAEFQAQQAHLQHQHDGSGSSSRNSSRRQSTISALSACDF